jgi:hypothetical protein
MKKDLMRPFTAAALTILPLLLAACSSKPRIEAADPFLTTEAAFKKSVKILAVAPVEIPPGLPDTATVADDFSALIDAELHRRGYTVIRPQRYTASWNRVSAEMGDFALVGSEGRDEAKMSEAMVRTMDALGADFKLDAVVFPSIVVVEAQFRAGRAVWDGAEQKIETAGAMESFFSGSQEGVVGALSLKLSIRDREGKTLFIHNGGIQVLSKMEGKSFVNVPRGDLFTDKERNRRAVEIAIEPLKR